MEKLKGLIAAPFTPMNDQGDLALDRIESLNNLYEKNKVNGAFICGTTGEGPSLGFNEKKQIIEEWGKVKSKDFKALFMLGGNSTIEMKELAIHSQKNNLDGVAILCPYYFKLKTEEELVSYCKEIADVVPEAPFYYYHIPGLSGGFYSMTKFLTLAEDQIPNLAGIKFSHPNIMEYHECLNFQDGKFDILWGVDEGLLSGLAIGAKGAIGSTYNYAAPLFNSIIDAFDSGDLEKAESLQFKAVEMVRLLFKYGGTTAGKAFMKIIGLDCGWFRLPISKLTNKDVRSLEKELNQIGFFEFCSKV